MKTRSQPLRESGGPRRAEVRAPLAAERAALLAWLDEGLRRGERGRLSAEHPLALVPGSPARHRIVRGAGTFLSHAMWSEAVAVSPGGRIRVGLVSLVYTAPRARGAGLASRCVESCARGIAERDIALALLWSEPGRQDFYRRLGFEPVGREQLLGFDPELCARAGGDPELGVADLDSTRVESVEGLLATHRVRAERPRGSLMRLAAAPETRVVVARAGEQPVAYAALGRGDDFRGVVHEWAGPVAGVLACLADLGREAGAPLRVVAGPDTGPDSLAARLTRAGASTTSAPFALARILDPAALWRAMVPAGGVPRLEGRPGRWQLCGAAGSVALSHAELLALCFGPSQPRRVLARLRPEERATLAQHLPRPLYLWGFDSF